MVLVEVNLLGLFCLQVKVYGVYFVLLDVCFQLVVVYFVVQGMVDGGLLLLLGVWWLWFYGLVCYVWYCCMMVIVCGVGVEVDLDVLDEYGVVVLVVCGLQLGIGVLQVSECVWVLGEWLLSIEWYECELFENSYVEFGVWLLISMCDVMDLVVVQLIDVLKVYDVQCIMMFWLQCVDYVVQVVWLCDQFGIGGFIGVFVLIVLQIGDFDVEFFVCGGEFVKYVVCIVCEILEIMV